MLRTTLAGLRAHKLRLVATGLAIVLGVGFVAGTLMFGDTAKAALFDQFARAARNVDLSVTTGATTGGKDTRAPELPLSTVDSLRAVPGIGSVDGRMQEPLPLLNSKGKLIANAGQPGVALSVGTVDALRPYDIASGRVPSDAGEAAVDTETLASSGYAIGDTLTVLDPQQEKHTLRLVGVVTFGSSKQYAGTSVVVLTEQAMVSLAGATGYSQVVASAAAGTSAPELLQRAGAAQPGLHLATGSQYRDDLANRAINQLSTFLNVLLIFALIACVVSAFVIYNTFNILMAQRVRDLALLRCIGAGRGQIFRSVVLESAIVGLVAAVIGIGAGVALAYGLFSGANALGAPLPAHALVLTADPIVIALLIGVVVTVISALIPALRATRVAPLAALRALPPLGPRGGKRRWLVVCALAVGVLGTALTVAGSVAPGTPQTATLRVVVGGILNFLAVLIFSPLLVGPLTTLIGWLPGKLFGVPVRLAVNNVRRNPSRAAATTAALMIGVGLMTSATVALATSRASATEQLSLHYPVDYILQPNSGGTPDTGIPSEVSQRLRARPELSVIAEVRLATATLDGQGLVLGTVDPTGLHSLIGSALPVVSGSAANFGPGSVILFDSAPAAKNKKVGDRVTLSTAPGRHATFTVAALASGQSQTGDAVVVWDDFAALHASTMDNMILAKAAHGVDPVASRAAIESVTDDYPLVSVASMAEWRSQITSAVDTIITVVAALLAIAIVIALIGIMNTLSLSVFERTRESALTRALGLTRGQLKATLLAEALLMGVIAAVVGVGFGVLYGWATTRVMFSGFAAVITIPIGSLLGYLVITGLAAVVAAVLPARTAGRTSIVAAMAQT